MSGLCRESVDGSGPRLMRKPRPLSAERAFRLVLDISHLVHLLCPLSTTAVHLNNFCLGKFARSCSLPLPKFFQPFCENRLDWRHCWYKKGIGPTCRRARPVCCRWSRGCSPRSGSFGAQTTSTACTRAGTLFLVYG
ncbi:hypothetical protein BpHYR1_020470 [Brachionus plicatilis]|uniref:Uncharacterized protein n=1 Tax=Brachionus plicatilis TaxID=10195 RepID=A0A3M7Q2J3_BRAPC|nr:hypothetical protein BpHYR1_020470 [Brachionus plicatilis]